MLYIPVKLSASQRSNLRLLATYLWHLPEDYKHFSMGDFSTKLMRDGELLHFQPDDERTGNPVECGTVCCALGHGPAAGIEPDDGQEWDEYSEKFLPKGLGDGYSREWNHLFHWGWMNVDNTPKGAAQRILELLRLGLPVNYAAQREGTDPNLTYKDQEL